MSSDDLLGKRRLLASLPSSCRWPRMAAKDEQRRNSKECDEQTVTSTVKGWNSERSRLNSDLDLMNGILRSAVSDQRDKIGPWSGKRVSWILLR